MFKGYKLTYFSIIVFAVIITIGLIGENEKAIATSLCIHLYTLLKILRYQDLRDNFPSSTLQQAQ